ncbi:MAG: hypothetical protein NT027_06390, partial [Proteobacteria bacterium]|nr:hypothetical protein [Pseudomonadota bacterium]
IQHSTKRIDDLKIMAEATCRNKPIVIQTEGPYTYVEEIDIMWASILTGIPSIIGYSGLVHPKYAENKIGSIEMTIDSLKAWLRFFDKEGDYCLLKSTKAQSSTN